MRTTRISLALVAALATTSLAEAHPHIFVDARSEIVFDPEGRISAVRQIWQFDEAFTAYAIQGLDADDEDALEEAIEAFTVLGRRAPSDHRITVYLGSAIALRARHTVWPWKKISHVEEGLELIDEALDARIAAEHDPVSDGVPASLTIELVAAETFLSIPDFFNRSKHHRICKRRRECRTLRTPALGDVEAKPFRRGGIKRGLDKRHRHLIG